MAGTESARYIAECILARLRPVVSPRNDEPSEKLYRYNYAGLIGQLALRDKPDSSNGRIGFVLYGRPSVEAARYVSFRRAGKQYPWAPEPIYLTATNVFAHTEGYQGKILEPPDEVPPRKRDRRWDEEKRQLYREWNAKLFKAIHLDVPVVYSRAEDVPKFVLPDLDDDFKKPFPLEHTLNRKRGLYAPHRRLMYLVYQHLAGRWAASAKAISKRSGTVTGWPRAIPAADVYLGMKLGAGVKARKAFAHAIEDLGRLGYIQAVLCGHRDEQGGYQPARANRKGMYWYFPGDEKPHTEPTRRTDITPEVGQSRAEAKAALAAYRLRQAQAWMRYWSQWMEHAGQEQEREQKQFADLLLQARDEVLEEDGRVVSGNQRAAKPLPVQEDAYYEPDPFTSGEGRKITVPVDDKGGWKS